MKKIYEEYKEIIIYTIIAAIIGVIVGIIDTIFGKVLLKITEMRNDNVIKLLPFLALAGILIIMLYRKFSEESLKGMGLVFQTGHGEIDEIPKRLIPLVILSTWITHLFGGSAGREGVAVQLGATISNSISKKLKFINKPRIFLVVWMAAGFASPNYFKRLVYAEICRVALRTCS